MRLIDADALMEQIENLQNGFKNPNWDESCILDGIESVQGLVEQAPTIGDWISADKRPPKQGRYLVWGLTQFVPDHNDEPNGYWQTKIAQWFETIGWDCKVKFWQMLPEPPEVQNETD